MVAFYSDREWRAAGRGGHVLVAFYSDHEWRAAERGGHVLEGGCLVAFL